MLDPIGTVAATLLGAVFLIAAAGKLGDPPGFVMAVLDYELLPRRLAIAYARLLPPAEALCGIGLLAGVWPGPAAAASAGILGSFLIAVSVNLVRGRDLACHCFGSRSGERLGRATLARLLLLLGCAVIVLTVSGAEPFRALSLPASLIGLGVVADASLIAQAPTLLRIFRTHASPRPTAHGTRVNLRDLPLVPIALAVKDRRNEVSRCGACP